MLIVVVKYNFCQEGEVKLVRLVLQIQVQPIVLKGVRLSVKGFLAPIENQIN